MGNQVPKKGQEPQNTKTQAPPENSEHEKAVKI